MSTEKERELFEERLRKLESLKKSGGDPYPAETKRTHTVAQAIEKFGALEKTKKSVTLAGRIRGLRAHGALIFGTLEDASGRLQFLLKKDEIGEKDFEQFTSLFDLGDFLEVTGTLMQTQRGEKTLLASSSRMLAKSLRALPDQWHGLKDKELLLRKRYLDMLSNPETRELFVKKSIFWQTVRKFMIDEGFLEVWTPVLENIPGGADAEPFVTHHKALDRDFYLRISLELPLKRLLVGGYEKVFEIGRLFRNEGIDRDHLQEYDDMEFYWAFSDDEKGMELVEELYKQIVKAVAGGMETEYEGKKINWSGKWPRVDYFEAFEKETGVDLNTASDKELLKTAEKLKIEIPKHIGRGRLIDAIYKKTVRPKLIQPCFVVGHPLESSPLAKKNPKDQRRILRFQPVAGGAELGNGFAELNDPLDQKNRFEEQMKMKAAGDKEAHMMDADYVEALEYGMPPAVGYGMSERLFAFLMNRSIRETVIFPPMRSEKHDEK